MNKPEMFCYMYISLYDIMYTCLQSGENETYVHRIIKKRCTFSYMYTDQNLMKSKGIGVLSAITGITQAKVLAHTVMRGNTCQQ